MSIGNITKKRISTKSFRTVSPFQRQANTILVGGNAKVSTAQSKFGGASSYYDGTGDYIYINQYDALNFTSSQSCTLEFFANNTAAPVTRFIFRSVGVNWIDLMFGSQGLRLRIFERDGYNQSITEGLTVSTNTWYHYALVKNGSTISIYRNGTQTGSITWAGNFNLNNGGVSYFGNLSTSVDPIYGFLGYVDEIRISNIARYTAGFTAPTSAFVNDINTLLLIHCNGANGSTTFTDDNS